MCPVYDSEITLRTGGGENSKVAPIKSYAWKDDDPASAC